MVVPTHPIWLNWSNTAQTLVPVLSEWWDPIIGKLETRNNIHITSFQFAHFNTHIDKADNYVASAE